MNLSHLSLPPDSLSCTMLRKCDPRRVAMTKAAVKNMLRLMEEFDPGRDDAVELDQYALFILQQQEITVAGREGNVSNSGDNNSSFTTWNDDNTGFTTRNEDSSNFTTRHNNNGNISFDMKKVPGAAATTREAGLNHAPSAAGACVSVVSASPRSTAVASIAATRGTTDTAVNLAMVPGNDAPEKPPWAPLQPVGDEIAGGTNTVSHSGRGGENFGACHPSCAEIDSNNGTGGNLGAVNASGAVGREGDTSSGSARGSDTSGATGGVEEAVVTGLRGQQQSHGSTRNRPSMLSTVTNGGSLIGTIASNHMVAGKGGNPVGKALDSHSLPELKVRRQKLGQS